MHVWRVVIRVGMLHNISCAVLGGRVFCVLVLVLAVAGFFFAFFKEKQQLSWVVFWGDGYICYRPPNTSLMMLILVLLWLVRLVCKHQLKNVCCFRSSFWQATRIYMGMLLAVQSVVYI